jgi:hypothetical protein
MSFPVRFAVWREGLREGFMFPKSGAFPDVFALLRNKEAGQGQIRGLGNFDVPVRSHQDLHIVAFVFHQAGLIGAVIAFRQGAVKALRRMA